MGVEKCVAPTAQRASRQRHTVETRICGQPVCEDERNDLGNVCRKTGPCDLVPLPMLPKSNMCNPEKHFTEIKRGVCLMSSDGALGGTTRFHLKRRCQEGLQCASQTWARRRVEHTRAKVQAHHSGRRLRQQTSASTCVMDMHPKEEARLSMSLLEASPELIFLLASIL